LLAGASIKADFCQTNPFIDNAKARVDWNHLLLTHAVTSPYIDALRSIPIEIAERDPGGFYDLWPSVEYASSPMIRDASIAIHQGLAATPYCRRSIAANLERCDRHMREAIEIMVGDRPVPCGGLSYGPCP
jgi:hypothetical protein